MDSAVPSMRPMLAMEFLADCLGGDGDYLFEMWDLVLAAGGVTLAHLKAADEPASKRLAAAVRLLRPCSRELVRPVASAGEWHSYRLLVACAENDVAGARHALSAGGDPAWTVQARGEDYRLTPVHVAARFGHAEVLELLLHAAAHALHHTTRYTLLQVARGAAVRVLLAAGADANDPGQVARGPLSFAVFRGDAEAVHALLAAGAWPLPPLRDAVQSGNVDVVRALLDKSTPNDIQGHWGDDALRCATYTGDAVMLRMLIDAGVDVDKKWLNGSTPLHNTCFYEHGECTEILLEAGARWDTENDTGSTPVHAAAKAGCVLSLRALVQHGADVAAIENDGCSPLYHAAWHGHVEAVGFLLQHGADVAHRNMFDALPLAGAVCGEEAAHALRQAASVLLIRAGARTDVDLRQYTFLDARRACYRGIEADVMHASLAVAAHRNAAAAQLTRALPKPAARKQQQQ